MTLLANLASLLIDLMTGVAGLDLLLGRDEPVVVARRRRIRRTY